MHWLNRFAKGKESISAHSLKISVSIPTSPLADPISRVFKRLNTSDIEIGEKVKASAGITNLKEFLKNVVINAIQIFSCRNAYLFIIVEKKLTKQLAASRLVFLDSPFRIRLGTMDAFLFGLMKQLMFRHNFLEEVDWESITFLK